MAGPRSGSMFGSTLIALGMALLMYALGMYLDVVPGGRVSVPRPPALERARAAPEPAVGTEAALSAVGPEESVVATVESAPLPVERTVAPPVAAAPPELPIPDVGDSALSHRPDPSVFATPMRPADAADRPYWGNRPRPGPAVSLKIPSIALETDVVTAGVVTNEAGDSEWETVPFVAAHYVDTALVGSHGNAVISGHVVTLREGNVFRNLYQMDFGETIEVTTAEGTFMYVVDNLKLVPPDAVDVMAPSSEPKLTLITCGGEFDPRTRQFSDRLVVVGRLADWSRHDPVQ